MGLRLISDQFALHQRKVVVMKYFTGNFNSICKTMDLHILAFNT